MTDAAWIIITGGLVAASCALLGTFLVLRQLSMVGDAISHAVLPGIAVAYLLTGSIASLPMVVGAASVGLLTTFLIETIHRRARIQTDAAIGVVFTFLFAVGVILITGWAGNADVDQQCVLYGEIGYVIFEQRIWGIPQSTLLLSINTALVLLFVLAGYRGLFLTAFDTAFAAAAGLSTALWHYLLMGAVSLTTVVSFESVGAILVVGFLIAPAATAWLITERLPGMLLTSVLLGVIASAAGYALAVWLDSSIAGAMTTVLGVEFLLALIFGPRRGLVWRFRKVYEPASSG